MHIELVFNPAFQTCLTFPVSILCGQYLNRTLGIFPPFIWTVPLILDKLNVTGSVDCCLDLLFTAFEVCQTPVH